MSSAQFTRAQCRPCVHMRSCLVAIFTGAWAAFPRTTMQLFLHAQNTHTLDVTGEETVGEIKVGCLLNGKVHGSLARAGKVKGQTPKVAKQEKRKKKTGRAKRRMQYNRRFVNVVPYFGKRKGPNSNS
ncbi:hypothetical protein scyTo_0002200 [Scyliorhinus torazame]|uniref:Uncharacterized protein n=1 Tax=Scyliorhinus torazame TaxID=75743 RepID=A0A401PI51_SCYTO|nr:hypothetical protein [Scyliorhinus torazame]